MLGRFIKYTSSRLTGQAGLLSTSVDVHYRRGESPLQVFVFLLVAEDNCVAARQGGE